jgi:sugar/nucleoside kinase (ribokinase family)
MHNNRIIGVGSVLVDQLINESDSFLNEIGTDKGGMTLVELEFIEKALKKTKFQAELVPGGSACNTLVGLGNLGARARMIGKCGKDEMAGVILSGLQKSHVEGRFFTCDIPTGRVLSVVTPDAQRTMFTYLGAAAELLPSDVKSEDFSEAALVYLEGYQLFNEPLTKTIIDAAMAKGAKLALDLASFEVVNATRPLLKEIIPAHVDILLSNEDEARAFTGKDEAASLEIFAGMCEIAVVKLGKAGALIACGDKRLKVSARPVKAVDSTGAGDLWASGFLFGIQNQYSLQTAAELGACVASEVVQVLGAVIPPDGWFRIKTFLNAQK